MDAKNLVQTLRYNCNLKVDDIASELNVNKVTIYNWISGSVPSDKKAKNLLKELIQRNYCDIKYVTSETREFLDEINKIKDEDWKDLILGLQEKLNLEQFELLKRTGLKKDFHISEWINGKRIPITHKKFKFLKLIKKLELQSSDLIDYGKDIRQSIKLNNDWLPVKNVLEIKEKGRENILIKVGKDLYLNSFCLFPEYRGKNKIKYISKGKKIIVFYDEKRSTRPQPLILPKVLHVNNDFLAGLGIYVGEGSRNRKPKVTNSEPLIINQAIKFFNFFGVSKHQLSVWIQLHERSLKSLDEVKNFWIKKTSIDKEKISKLRIKKSCGNALVKQHGVLHVEANFILLQFLIEKLIAIIPHLMENLSNEKTVPFLQGLFAAEGSVSIAKSGSLREVRYTSKRDDERDLVKELLEKQGIVVHEYKKGFDLRIHGFDNLKRLVEIYLFKYHPERNRKFKKGFKKLKISKKLINF